MASINVPGGVHITLHEGVRTTVDIAVRMVHVKRLTTVQDRAGQDVVETLHLHSWLNARTNVVKVPAARNDVSVAVWTENADDIIARTVVISAAIVR